MCDDVRCEMNAAGVLFVLVILFVRWFVCSLLDE